MAIELQASAPDKVSPIVTVEAWEGELTLVDLAVSEDVLAAAMETARTMARLQGVVRSAETGDPLIGARVALPELGVERITGTDGSFAIPEVPVGRHRVVTEYVGMASDTVTVALLGDVANLVLLALETSPVAVPELRVEVERRYAHPRIQEFYDRKKRGIGRFVTREDIGTGSIEFALRRIPGVRVYPCGRSAGGYCLRVRRGASALGRGCRGPRVYLDGFRLFEGGADVLRRLNSLRHRIEGIEVYQNVAGIPGRFRSLDDACGVLLVWTRPR
jgi:hypothetical protein